MKATIKDIARKTGLSITTVSMVMNNTGGKFSARTRKLVLDTAAELNYRPNQMAVGLHTKKSRSLGLIIPDIRNLFFSELAKGVEDFSRRENYTMLLCNTDDMFEEDCRSFEILADRGADGVIVAMSAGSQVQQSQTFMDMLRTSGIPVILADSFDDTQQFSTVAINNRAGSALAMEHLISLGHRRIACISGPPYLHTNQERLNGYWDALKAHGIRPEPSLLVEGDFRYNSGYDGAVDLMAHCPTAIFCHNDLMAFGAVKALRDNGYRVPENVSVMGFDDIFFSRYMDVPLSTVKQPAYQMGIRAAAILLEEIAHPEAEKQHLLLEPKLEPRASTAPPPK